MVAFNTMSFFFDIVLNIGILFANERNKKIWYIKDTKKINLKVVLSITFLSSK